MILRPAAFCLVLGMLVSAARADDLHELTVGVTKITTPGVPGRIAVFGPQAFAVVLGKADNTIQPAVAAARYGRGRIVIFGHDGYFAGSALREADTGRFFANAINWAGAGSGRPAVVVAGKTSLSEAVRSLGLATAPADLAQLSSAAVLIADANRISRQNVGAIGNFIRAGGGFITSATGWGWQQLNPGKNLAGDLAVNHVLIPAGLAFAGGTLSDTAPEGFAVSAEVPRLSNAGVALAAVLASVSGPPLNKDAAELASASLLAAVENLPANDTSFLPKLRPLTSNPNIHALPTPKKPVKATNLASRVAVSLQANSLRRALPGQVKAHPAAGFFPGSVPVTAPRLNDVTVNLNTVVRDWHSTGLYAAPGDSITIVVPPNAAKQKLRVRIGAHQDRLWHLDTWKRFPEITQSWPLDTTMTRVANAFGGLVYLEAPRGCTLGQVPVKISGAVQAPLYLHGQTGIEDWKTTLRHHPAPWGELASAKVILTLPAEVLRDLDDPKALMDTWDRVLDLDAELAALPRERERPERIVCDIQISAGYMHSGYPIMAGMDQPKNFASRESLIKGNWGIFHELGHNHQVKDWTFEGTGEVTCNLFSLYVFDKLCGVKPAEYVHGRNEARIIDLDKKYFAAGPPSFDRWKQDPFVALCLYVQLQDAFGWEPYQKVFAEYRALPDAQRPKSEQDRRDQWLVRYSKAVGRNLGPFFKAWGIPVTEGAAASVANLPAWLPAGMK